MVFIYRIKACYVINSEEAKKVLGEDALDRIKAALWLIDRVGDTESLSSVSGVEGPLDLSLIGDEGEINTIANESLVELVTQAYIDSMGTVNSFTS